MAVVRAATRRSCAKAMIDAAAMTKTSNQVLDTHREKQELLVAEGGYSLLVILQVLLETSPIGYHLFDLAFEFSFPLRQFL